MAQNLLFDETVARAHRDRELEQLVARYVRNLPKTLTILHEAIQDCDGRSALAVVHRLSGTSGMYGLWSLNEVAMELYDDLQSGESIEGAVVPRHVSKLEEIVGMLLETFETPL